MEVGPTSGTEIPDLAELPYSGRRAVLRFARWATRVYKDGEHGQFLARAAERKIKAIRIERITLEQDF